MATLIPIPIPSDYDDDADVPSVLSDMQTAIATNETAINDEVISIASEIGDIGEALDIIQGEVI